jgi:hypothetical protein
MPAGNYIAKAVNCDSEPVCVRTKRSAPDNLALAIESCNKCVQFGSDMGTIAKIDYAVKHARSYNLTQRVYCHTEPDLVRCRIAERSRICEASRPIIFRDQDIMPSYAGQTHSPGIDDAGEWGRGDDLSQSVYVNATYIAK